MRQTLNFTGRIKLPKERFDVRLDTDGKRGIVFSFHAAPFEDLGLPGDAVIIAEVYRGGVRVRIPCGMVRAPARVERRPVPNLSESDNPQIRIRVINRSADQRGLVLAQLIPKGFHPAPAPTRSLLHMRTEDLGDRIWDVSTDEPGGPVLRINKALDGAAQLLAGSSFQALVLPQLMRDVALWLTEADPESIEDDGTPEHLWLTYIEQRDPDLRDRFDQLLESLPNADATEKAVQRREWADDAANALAGDLGALQIMQQELKNWDIA